jgi:hypothetical protein
MPGHTAEMKRKSGSSALIIVFKRLELYIAGMESCKRIQGEAYFSRRRLLRLAAFMPLFLSRGPRPIGAAPPDAEKVRRLSADCDIVFVSSLGFVDLQSEPVALMDKTREYLSYGNPAARRMLAARTVRPDRDLLKACVRDWPSFARRVRRDALEAFYPGSSGEPLKNLNAYSAIGMSVKLTAAKIHYDFGVAALAGNDDVDGDGFRDGLDREMLERAGETGAEAVQSPDRLLRGLVRRARALDGMSIDELYEHGAGVCRHQTIVAMAVFRVLKEGDPDLTNLYLTGLASVRDRHQWLMAAAVAPDKVTAAFYDPTASSAHRARAVRAFTDADGKRRYTGIPDEAELRRAMGLAGRG